MTSSTPQWHVRRQRPDARTTIVWFIDPDANRLTFRQFFDYLESSAPFREMFIAALASAELKPFVWEMPRLGPTSLAGELECALTEVPPPKKKAKIDPRAFSAHFRPDAPVVVIPSPDGDGQLVVPCPKQAEGWYADVPTFVRRVHPSQVHALWQTLARTAKAALATQTIWLSSSAPGAPWLSLRVGTSPKSPAFARYAR